MIFCLSCAIILSIKLGACCSQAKRGVMAVALVDELAIKDNLTGRALKDIYIEVELVDGSRKFVPLTKIQDVDSKILMDEEETTDRSLALNRFISSPANWYVNGKEIRRAVSLKPMIATTIVSTSADNPSAYGMKQMLGLTKIDAQTYGENTKLFVKLDGDRDFVLINAKDVFVFKNGTSKLLSQLDETELANLSSADLYYNSRKILTLDQSKFDDKVIEQEGVAVTRDSSGHYSYVLHSFELNEDNTIKSVARSLSDTVTTQTYVNDRNLGKITENRKFELDVSRQGGHIYVVDSLGNKIFVDINNLYEGSIASPRQINVARFKQQPNEADVANSCLYFVGKKLLLKVKDAYIELQPLTAEQVIKVYANNTRYATPTTDKNDIMADGVFRLTKDGRFVEEKSLSPICYDYASDSATDFTAYLFEFDLEGNTHTVVLDKTKFSTPTININFEGRSVSLSLNGAKQPRKLVRVNKSVIESAVVQTSNGLVGDYNTATVIRNDVNDRELTEDEKKLAQQTQDKFVVDYKSGDYVLTNVYDGDGNLVEFSERSARYKMEDCFRTTNSANNNFKTATMTMVNGKFRGAETFDAKKANKKYNKSAVNLSINMFKFMITPLGLISMLAFPVVPIVAVGALVSIPIANIVNRVRQRASKGIVGNVKAPIKEVGSAEILQLVNEMYLIANQTEKVWQEEEAKAKHEDKKAKRTHTRVSLSDEQVNTFLVNMGELEKHVDLMFADRTTTESFTVVNGRATITPENAYLAMQYEEKVKDTQKQIKALQKRVKHAKGAEKTNLQAKLGVLTDEYDRMTKGTYTMTYASVDGNAQLKESTFEHINFVKGFVLTKFKDYDSLTNEEQKMLDKINVDLGLGSIKYKGKLVSVDTLLHDPKCSALVGKILFKGESAKAELETTDGTKLGRVETAEITTEHASGAEHEAELGAGSETETEHEVEHGTSEETAHELGVEFDGFSTEYSFASGPDGYSLTGYSSEGTDELTSSTEVGGGAEVKSSEESEEILDASKTVSTEVEEKAGAELTGETSKDEDTTEEAETVSEIEHPYDVEEYVSYEMEDFDKLLEEALAGVETSNEEISSVGHNEETDSETEPYNVEEYVSDVLDEFDTEFKEATNKNTSTTMLSTLTENLAKAEELKTEALISVDDLSKKLEADNLTEEDVNQIKEGLETIELRLADLKDNIDQANAIISENTETKEEIISEIEQYTQQLNELSESLNNCNNQIESLEVLLNQKLSEAQAKKVASNVEKVTEISNEITKNADKLVASATEKADSLNGLKLSDEDRAKLENMQKAIDLLKTRLENAETEQDKAKEIKTKVVTDQSIIIEKAENTIQIINAVLGKTKVDETVYNEMVDSVTNRKTYGVKTKLLAEIKSYKDMIANIDNQYSIIDDRIEMLNTVIKTVETSDDEDLKKVQTYAQFKIEQLNKKKVQLDESKAKVQIILEKCNNLKRYLDLKAFENKAEKTMTNPLFNADLQANETGIEFLAKVIDTIKKLDKQQKAIKKYQVGLNRKTKADVQNLNSEKLPEILKQLKAYVRDNYNIFNDCTDNNLKAKYYDKIADYSKYDHDVVFELNNDTNKDADEGVTT